MRDVLGREIHDLRVSVTDRCNLRCQFCMPESENYEFFPRSEVLRFEEIERIVRVAVPLGVRKVRLTGGEPLVRRGIENLIHLLSKVDGLEDISMTTNGLLLSEKAYALKESGLKRVTVSFHSLKDDVFSQIVGKKVEVSQIVKGIEAAIDSGLKPVKANVCVVRDLNDGEVLDVAKFFKEMGVVVRFIEFMDVGTVNAWSLERVVSAKEIVSKIAKEFDIEPVEKSYRGEVAEKYRYKDDGLEFGIISSVTQPFCGDCNRLRLTADGKLLTCLFASYGHDIKSLLRHGARDEEIGEFIKRVWESRKDRYSEERLERIERGENFRKVEMFQVGG
ncbi:MAG: GTP 3',8-cyclase MoaA [Aquificaceae bacterium]